MRPHRAPTPVTRARALAAACAAAVLLLPLYGRAGQTPPAATAGARPSFDELYRRGQQVNEGIRTLSARFTETTTSALLERPLMAAGMLYVQRSKPPRVAMHYEEAGRMLVIDGNRMTNAWPARQILLTSDISRAQRNVEKYFGASDPRDIRKLFDITLRDASSRPGAHEVMLVPRERRISEALSRLDLWVEESSGLLKAMRMSFSNGDTKLMEFENVVTNAPIDAAVFSAPK